jgi:hypothetical protein
MTTPFGYKTPANVSLISRRKMTQTQKLWMDNHFLMDKSIGICVKSVDPVLGCGPRLFSVATQYRVARDEGILRRIFQSDITPPHRLSLHVKNIWNNTTSEAPSPAGIWNSSSAPIEPHRVIFQTIFRYHFDSRQQRNPNPNMETCRRRKLATNSDFRISY